MQPPDNRQGRWVSFADAMLLLRMSEGTLRRAIRAGKVLAEPEPREPGTSRIVWRVFIPDPPADATSEASSESEHPPDIRHEPPRVARDEDVERIVELHERLLEAYVEIGNLKAEKASAETRATMLQADATRERARADDLAERLKATEEERDAARRERDARAAELAAERERPWWKRVFG